MNCLAVDSSTIFVFGPFIFKKIVIEFIRQPCNMPNSEQNPEECDATEDDSSNEDGLKIVNRQSSIVN